MSIFDLLGISGISLMNEGNPSIPTLSTEEPSHITATTALSGGNIIDDGGLAITARGVCWNTTGSPTILDSTTSDGTGSGEFTSELTGLTPSTTYYVSAYATNSEVTSYGDVWIFSTIAAGRLIVPRDDGSWGTYGHDVIVGNTHYTGRDEGSYAEIGQDVVVGSTHYTDRTEGSYGVYEQADVVEGNVVTSSRTNGSYGVAGQKDQIDGNVVTTDRTDGSFGTKGGKSTVTYTARGATVVT